MGIILSMIRFTQVSVIFNLPSIAMIDINARRLMHTYLYTVEFDRTTARPGCAASGVFWYEVRTPGSRRRVRTIAQVCQPGCERGQGAESLVQRPFGRPDPGVRGDEARGLLEPAL